jgi:hypothetical protein
MILWVSRVYRGCLSVLYIEEFTRLDDIPSGLELDSPIDLCLVDEDDQILNDENT